ncbi:OsmC family protein [Flavobacterium aestivum]|uniref:OsmC family protein n=1 Tax=Flavobacterium aestivum TaxID=3003257 RepID=UPI00248301D9|nr:OsmC family protein [Flavobacterium aestivum]
MENLFENDILGHIGTQKYLCNITWRKGQFLMDEPENTGGKDLGMDPFSTLLASLAGCTLSTLRMYIDRKEWAIPEINISLNLYQETLDGELTTTIKRNITFSEEVSVEQKDRLLIIADKCPISKLLKGNITINTSL